MKSKLIIGIAATAIVGAALAWILLRLDWQEFAARLAGASPTGLALMALAWMSSMLMRPVRFRFLLNVLGKVQGANYRTIWGAMVLGLAVNSFLPMRAGDLVMAVFLRQRLRVDMHRTFTVIVADWACDFLCVSTVFLGALAFAPAVAAWTDRAIFVLIALLIAGAIAVSAVVRYRVGVLTLTDLFLARVFPRWRARGHEIAQEALDSLAIIGTWRTAVPLLLISATVWGLMGLSYWFGLRAVFPEAPAAAAAFNMSAVTLSFAIPLGLGGMGAFEAASVLSLALFGIPLEAAIAFAVIAHAFQLGSVILFTTAALLTGQIDYRSLRPAPEKQR